MRQELRALPIPFTVPGLLAWHQWIPSVVPVARASTAIQPIGPFELTPKLQEPGALHTLRAQLAGAAAAEVRAGAGELGCHSTRRGIDQRLVECSRCSEAHESELSASP